MRGQGTFNDPYLVETVADFVSRVDMEPVFTLNLQMI